MVPLFTKYMKMHEALFLEEPPREEFYRMLAGVMTIEDYLMTTDSEYPYFTKSMCSALRELYSSGKKIFQVEPYLENLLALHDFFADGFRPDDIARDTLTYPVYQAEKNATGALLAYYQIAATGSFGATVDAVKRFARADAARFRLRDALRSQALALHFENFSSLFIEAGVMHYPLKRLLERQASQPATVRSVFLANDVLKKSGQKRHLYGPGDQLTLLYIFHPVTTEPDRESLLAARALIYSKIILKEELQVDGMPHPNLTDELLCIDVTRSLSLEDCRRLFALIRGVKTGEARRIVGEFVGESSPRCGQTLKKWMPPVASSERNDSHEDTTL